VRDPSLLDSLLEAVPDEPSLIDTRGVLLEEPELFGDADGCVAVRAGGRLLVAIGAPDRESFTRALAHAHPEAALVASGEAIGHAQRHLKSDSELAYVHVAGVAGLRPDLEAPAAVLLDPATPLDRLPAELRRELEEDVGGRPVGAVLEEGVPVSVSYPALVTERFWDVSVETLEGYRRRGCAAAAFLRLECEMRRSGLEPVWGALESNTASLALAAKLGFERVGELMLFKLQSHDG
jgi:GNAT superfamily N-acetyltransferase